MLQPKRAVMALILKGMLKGAGARLKVWLTKRRTLLLTLQTVPPMWPVVLTSRVSNMSAKQVTGIPRPSATINEPHRPSSTNSLSPHSYRCWRSEQSALVWPGSLVV
ncbi:hypothetical protein BB934_07365 [Microvirga ossetica]|uniref:Uncharacterized protein n=1 Tax=Microvirga ossetica TaxID=1882682 RepID=A0A1B2EDM5_9HYPH|nr:hypothetical protein BB934_07365 [Microvirga ossetica]